MRRKSQGRLDVGSMSIKITPDHLSRAAVIYVLAQPRPQLARSQRF